MGNRLSDRPSKCPRPLTYIWQNRRACFKLNPKQQGASDASPLVSRGHHRNCGGECRNGQTIQGRNLKTICPCALIFRILTMAQVPEHFSEHHGTLTSAHFLFMVKRVEVSRECLLCSETESAQWSFDSGRTFSNIQETRSPPRPVKRPGSTLLKALSAAPYQPFPSKHYPLPRMSHGPSNTSQKSHIINESRTPIEFRFISTICV